MVLAERLSKSLLEPNGFVNIQHFSSRDVAVVSEVSEAEKESSAEMGSEIQYRPDLISNAQ